MYCPKCGGQNSDDLAYCRECGANLTAISQVMHGHATLAIASKIDAVFQRKYERLRREAFWSTGTGVIATVWTLAAGPLIPFGNELFQTFSSIAIPLFFFYDGVANYLAYRRSLELEGGPSSNETVPAEASDDPTSDQQVYCSKCGIPNSGSKQFCSSCGFRLAFEPRGMEKYLPGFLIRWMDRRIRWNEWFLSVPRQGWRVLTSGLAMVVAAVSMGLLGKMGMAAFYSFLALSTFVNSGWDYLTYIRTAKSESAGSDTTVSETYESTWDEFRAFTRKPEEKFKLWTAGIFLLLSIAGPFFYESGTFFFWIVALMMAAALMLDFKKFRAGNRKGSVEDAFESHTLTLQSNETSALDPHLDETRQIVAVDEFRKPQVGDTARFASPSESVTEDTTKQLTGLSEPSQDEPLTTQKLKDGSN